MKVFTDIIDLAEAKKNAIPFLYNPIIMLIIHIPPLWYVENIDLSLLSYRIFHI